MGSQVDPTPDLEVEANVQLGQWVVAVAVPASSPHHDTTVEVLGAHSTAMMTRGPEVYALVDLPKIADILTALEPVANGCGVGVTHGACWKTDSPPRLAGPAVDEARALARKRVERALMV